MDEPQTEPAAPVVEAPVAGAPADDQGAQAPAPATEPADDTTTG